MPVHGSDVNFLGMHAANLYRLKRAGYPDSRLSGLTTVEGLIADIRTFSDLRNPNAQPRFEAAVDTIRWMKSNGLITDALVAVPFTTVYDITVSATTDLSYLVRGNANYPSASFGSTPDQQTVNFPAH